MAYIPTPLYIIHLYVNRVSLADFTHATSYHAIQTVLTFWIYSIQYVKLHKYCSYYSYGTVPHPIMLPWVLALTDMFEKRFLYL